MGYYYVKGEGIPEEWTFCKSLLLLMVTFILLLVFVMLASNYNTYEYIAKTFSWFWGSLTAILSSIGVVKKRNRSLTDLLDVKPIRWGIVFYFVVTAFVFSLSELPIHWVKIKTEEFGGPKTYVTITWGGSSSSESGDSVWTKGWLRRGEYIYTASLEGYKPKPGTVRVNLWQIVSLSEVNFTSADSTYGRLYVESDHDPADIFLVRVEEMRSDTIIPGSYAKQRKTGGADTLDRLRAGIYELRVTKQIGKGRYIRTTRITIETDKVAYRRLDLSYEPPPRGRVTVVSKPAGADIYLHNVFTNKQTPATLDLEYGKYTLVLRKKEGIRYGYLFKREIRVDSVSRMLDTVYLKQHVRKLRPINVYSDPQASVFVAGKYEGQSNSTEPVYLFVGEDDDVVLKEYGYHDKMVRITYLPWTDVIPLEKKD